MELQARRQATNRTHGARRGARWGRWQEWVQEQVSEERAWQLRLS